MRERYSHEPAIELGARLLGVLDVRARPLPRTGPTNPYLDLMRRDFPSSVGATRRCSPPHTADL